MKRRISSILCIIVAGVFAIPSASKAAVWGPGQTSASHSKDLRRPEKALDTKSAGRKVEFKDLMTKGVNTGIGHLKGGLRQAMKGDGADDSFWNRFYFDVYLQDKTKPVWAIETIQPLWEDEDNTFFTEIRLSTKKRFGRDRHTGNFGLGYRRFFMDGKVMTGLNVFYDHELPYNHMRVGTGLEVLTSFMDLRANIYLPVSESRGAGKGVTEKAVSGFDFELGIPLPYLPTTKFFVKHFHWNTVAKAGKEGQQYALELKAGDFFTLESGVIKAKKEKSKIFGRINVRIPLQGFEDYGWGTIVGEKAYEFKSVREQRLMRVRRHHDIVVERTVASGGGVSVSVVRL